MVLSLFDYVLLNVKANIVTFVKTIKFFSYKFKYTGWFMKKSHYGTLGSDRTSNFTAKALYEHMPLGV